MNATDSKTAQPAPGSTDGAITRLIKKVLLRQSAITSIEALSTHFSSITLQGDSLRNIKWTPGDKIQLSLSNGFSNRTYTPIAWDSARGITQFIAYRHGNTATCAFFATAQAGMSVQLMGPRSSLDVSHTAANPLLFGDETCFGLAAALHRANPSTAPEFVFEVDDLHQARTVLQALALPDAILVLRKPADGHMTTVVKEILRLAPFSMQFILAGRAGSIQAVKRALNGAGISNGQIKAKAYWAPGKIGLD